LVTFLQKKNIMLCFTLQNIFHLKSYSHRLSYFLAPIPSSHTFHHHTDLLQAIDFWHGEIEPTYYSNKF
jgi:hypothetical protein